MARPERYTSAWPRGTPALSEPGYLPMLATRLSGLDALARGDRWFLARGRAFVVVVVVMTVVVVVLGALEPHVDALGQRPERHAEQLLGHLFEVLPVLVRHVLLGRLDVDRERGLTRGAVVQVAQRHLA